MLDSINAGVFIGGAWRPAEGGTLDVVSPSTGAVAGAIARGAAADVDAAVTVARSAMEGIWGGTPAVERGRILSRFSALIGAHHDELARLECLDTGKPLSQARADITACARYFEFYGGAADKLHGDTIPFQEGYTVMTLREPYGVCGLIIPWNYPAQIFGRTVGGALAAGNTVVLKPAEDACLSVLRLTALLHEAGLPDGVLNVVPGLGSEAGAALAGHGGIDHLSFTGSPAAGTLVTQAAARHHVPVTLELGGKSPQVVFADADLDAALPMVVRAIVQNAGQTCSAGSRLLVEASIAEAVTDRLAEMFSALRCAPGEDDADCGPLINARQKAGLMERLDRALSDGIALRAQGQVAPGAPDGGHYVPPMLLTDVPEDHEVAREELFGPVLGVLPFKDEADALRIANGTDFGLVAGVWTRDGGRQMRMARRLRSGQVYINNYGAGGGVELPFGGVKKSGHGREKGFEGMKGFTVLKTVAIRHD